MPAVVLGAWSSCYVAHGGGFVCQHMAVCEYVCVVCERLLLVGSSSTAGCGALWFWWTARGGCRRGQPG